MGQSEIVIKGAREHNLKDIDLTIPRDQLVVITGLSGSGKSSLAFDTMYAEGQRRYVESLSSYARMFLGQMSKPDLDSIDGLSPAVSIDQKTTSKNPRSTVGTTTEIYDYLRLLFARVGIPHCPECGREDQEADHRPGYRRGAVAGGKEGRKAVILAPVVSGRKGEFTKLFADLQKEGFTRVRVDGEMLRLEGEPLTLDKKYKHFIDVVVDRVTLKGIGHQPHRRSGGAGHQAGRGAGAGAAYGAGRQAHGPRRPHILWRHRRSQGGGVHWFRWRWRAQCTAIPWTSCSPAISPSTPPTAPVPIVWALAAATRLMLRWWCPTRPFPSPRAPLPPSAAATTTRNTLAAVVKHLGESPDTPWEDLPRAVQKGVMEGLGKEKVRVELPPRWMAAKPTGTSSGKGCWRRCPAASRRPRAILSGRS